ncbi:BspA family leucine-rich repeat surface protein [Mycoplasma capricolum]|uniref:BspA family leucine-rich repeat surface protein n=1 Tax=Mycoplasma capricolum TaxID=2095 RepID=UPI0022F3A502|nr:BspA family leucine-rich repeat surface protein [Mycoplasma capricolum]WBX36365.1 BspA family leucine-rich repeat surface protein [Mycoplasma capricolum subsp. capricolum]
MKRLLKIISSLTILSTGVLSVSCTNKQTNPNKNINEQNSSSRNRRSIPDTSEIKLETVVSEDIKNKGITALQKVFKEQEDAFGSFHTHQDVVDQLKVYLKDSNIYHLNYLKLANEDQKNTKLQVDNNSSEINKLNISYFDKTITFIPKTVLKDEVKEKYDKSKNQLLQIGYKLDNTLKSIKMKTVDKNTKKVPPHLPLKINSLDNAFRNLESERIDNLDKWKITNVKYLTETFSDTTTFDQDISNWDVSNVIDMTKMFAGAKKFNQNLNSWDTRNVKTMHGMFWDAENFNGSVFKWNIKKVEDMQSMFSGAFNFNQDLNEWDTSKVENMEGMFSNTKLFNGDISKWNISNVTSMRQMFQGAKGFKRSLSSWKPIKVTHAKDFRKDAESNIPKENLPRFSEEILKTL